MYANAGPKPEKGTAQENKNDMTRNRNLKGISSPTTNTYESCEADASPTKTVPPMSIGMLVATALMMQPRRAMAEPPTKNHLRPK